MFDENGNGAMAMVNHLMNVKDSRWLQVEVCREFQRGQCSREFNECKFAHPPAHVEVQNGRVTACYDSIKKGRCNRENPKCKYLHPPQHIKDQLLINGRNNLALKNLIMNQLTSGGVPAPGFPPGVPGLPAQAAPPNPFLAQQLAQVGGVGGLSYPGYYAAISPGAMYSPGQPQSIPVSLPTSTAAADPAAASAASTDLSGQLMGGSPVALSAAQQKARTDRVEALAAAAPQSSGSSAESPPAGPANRKRRLDDDGGAAQLLQAQQLHQAAMQAQLHQLLAQQQPQQPQDAAAANAAAVQQHQLLLAAAAMQQQQQQQSVLAMQTQKRMAMEAKSGVPVYQPAMHQASDGLLWPYAVSVSGSTAAGLGAYAAYAQPQQFAQFAPAGYMPALALGGGGVGGGVGGGGGGTSLPANANNTASVAYFDESGQLLDTLPVCRDFKQAHCERPSCRYVHLLEDYVEVHEGKVTVCRDYAKGKCSRVMCKYYHVPILHPTQSALLLQPPSAALPASLFQQTSAMLPPTLPLFSIAPLQSA